MKTGMSPKEDAVSALVQFEKSSTSMKTLLRELQTASADTPNSYSEANILPISVIRRRNTIDYLLTRFLGTTKLHDLDAWERNKLRLLLYETKWLDQDLDELLPSYPEMSTNSLSIIRQARAVDLNTFFDKLPTVNKLSLKYSHPTFIVRTMLDNLSHDQTIQLLKANNQNRTYYLRVNQLLCEDSSVLDTLEHVTLKEDNDIQGVFRVVEGIENIVKSKSFHDGLILIQDKASMLTVETLNPCSGEVIWDSCGAPGMKTQRILEKLKGTGKVIATDVYQERVRIAVERSHQLGAESIEWVHADAAKPVISRADKILIDAPCTSTGILQAYPSFKWRINKTTLFSLMTVQNKILEGVLTRYSNRPGTEIVFSTCSILPHEGESQIDSVLSKYNVELLDPIGVGDKGYPDFECSDQVTRLFPHKHSTSGFFIAHLRIKQ